MMTLILWILLFIFSWPLALMALILYPFFLILSIPFRLLGITLDAIPCGCGMASHGVVARLVKVSRIHGS